MSVTFRDLDAQTTTGKTLTLTVGSDGVSAGDVVIINAYSTGTIDAVQDSQGNDYALQVKAGEFHLISGAITAALSPGDTLLLTWSVQQAAASAVSVSNVASGSIFTETHASDSSQTHPLSRTLSFGPAVLIGISDSQVAGDTPQGGESAGFTSLPGLGFTNHAQLNWAYKPDAGVGTHTYGVSLADGYSHSRILAGYQERILGEATIQGVGSINVSAATIKNSQAGLYGVGAVTLAAAQIMVARAALVGVGTLVASAANIGYAARAALIGTGSIDVSANVLLRISAALHGTGSLYAVAKAIMLSADLYGIGSLTCNAVAYHPADAALVGQGTVACRAEISFFKRQFHRVADYTDLITSEHADKPKFLATMEAVLKPLSDIQALISALPDYFDIDLAIGKQLDAIGEWENRSRYLEVPLPQVFFSWGIEGLGWGEARWKHYYDPDEGVVRLDDDSYRTLLRAVALANKWDGTTTGAYEVWETLGFPVLVQDNIDMSMLVAFQGLKPDAITWSLLTHNYIKTRPVGVKVAAYVTESVADKPFFGFGVDNSAVGGWGHGAWGVFHRSEIRPKRITTITDAALVGAGALTAVARPEFASLHGVGALTARAVQRKATSADLRGVGKVTAVATGGLP